MRLFTLCISSFTIFATSLFSQKPYEVVEDTATLPLLNPSMQERKTAKIRLKNGLEAYLISDPNTEQSAASLSVGVGSWNDPKEYPGMAHFLEHMLFMGTKAYPDESEYAQFIHDHGGTFNAFTAPDRTVYLFSIDNNDFVPLLDRFSHFFIDPLFSRSCIDREMYAVDQEFAKNIENDDWRLYMVLKQTGNPNHPNIKFSTGNASTLSGIPQDALKQWYQTHYSASIMHLIVLSPIPIEQLVPLVEEHFSKIPQFAPSITTTDDSLTSPLQRGHMIYVEPINESRTLTLRWEIPPALVADQESKPAEMIAYILGNDGEKSLIWELKQEKLANEILVESSRESHKDAFFLVNIDLTELGLSQVDTVIERCFQAIARAKNSGVSPSLFQEQKKIAALSYQYQPRIDAFKLMNLLGNLIIDEDLSSFPEKSFIPSSYNPASYAALLQHLTPENALFILQADPSLVGKTTNQQEKWLGAKFTVEAIAKDKLVSLQQSAPHPNIQLPERNPYLPSTLQLVADQNATQQAPKVIYEQKDATIYFAQDTTYKTPEIAALFSIKSPLFDGSTKTAALTDLYLIALEEKLSSSLFFARQAGLGGSFNYSNFALQLSFHGFNDKAHLLLKEIFLSLNTLSVSQEQYDLFKARLSTLYENGETELPLKQALELTSSLLLKDSTTKQEKLFALNSLSYEEFALFTKTLFQQAYVQSTLYGNLSYDEALSLWKELKNALGAVPYLTQDHQQQKVLLLPEKSGPFQLVQQTPRQGCGVVLLIEESPFTFSNRAAQQILSTVLHDAFYTALRTKQQTAYIADSWDREYERQLFQFFVVQSSSHAPQELLTRFELFIEEFLQNFSVYLPKERFATIQKSLTTTLDRPVENLSKKGEQLHLLAFQYDGDFDWIAKRSQAVQKLSYEQLQEYALQVLSKNNSRRLALIMEGSLSKERAFQYKSINREELNAQGRYIAWK